MPSPGLLQTKEIDMNHLKVAARFVAFTYYLNNEIVEPHSPEDAAAFARAQWRSFLPYVDDSLGRFLTAPPCESRVALSV
jgi:hypothetical protein